MKKSFFSETLNLTKDKRIKFNIDLNKGNITIDNNNIDLNQYDNLIQENDLMEYGIENIISNPIDALNKIYKLYKFSSPSKGKSKFFKAYEIDELTDYQLMVGKDRYLMQLILELYIYILKEKDIMPWIDKHWFYQGIDKEFIILKKWIKK